jgi:polysaccharide biosynthesis transport protein
MGLMQSAKDHPAGPPLMRTQFPASPDDIDLMALGIAVRRALLKLVLATLAVGLASFVVLSLITPKYVSQTQIEITSKGVGNPFEPRRDSNNPELVSVRMDKEAIATHVRSLMSNDLALKVAADLHLASKPEFNSKLIKRGPVGQLLHFVGLVGPREGESEEDLVLAAYYDALRVYQIKDTRGIMIEFRSADPKLAAGAANKLAELYRDDLGLRAALESKDARSKLGPQIKKLAEEVAEAEAEVTRFRGQANIFDGGRDKASLNDQQLSELTGELTRVATARAETEARAREAREIVARGSAETLPDVQKSQLVPRLVEQRVRVERQIAELSATLLPAHPRMRQLNADLAGLNRQIRGEVEKIVQGLEREAKVSALREEGIRRRIDEAKKRVVSSGGDDVKLRALESLAKSKRAEFERLQSQVESARTTSDALAVPVEVQIVSRARPSSEKAWPKVGMMTLLAMTATLLLGLAFVVTRELFTMARQAPAGSRSIGGVAAIPAALQSPLPAVASPVIAARTVPSVARHLVAKAQGRTGFRTLVTGESGGADAALVAIELARQLARQTQQVILLDWSLDGVGLAPELGVSPTLGIVDVLSGRASFEDVIERMAGSEAHVIAAGSSAAGTAAAKDKDRVNMLLDALDDAYDHVVIAGGWDALRDLFTTIEGRIDAGVIVASGEEQGTPAGFLGFTVADLDVIRYEPQEQQRSETSVLALGDSPR